MLFYTTKEENLALSIISLIDNTLGYPSQYTQTWSYAPKQRITDDAWIIQVPDVDIAIPFGNVATETYSIDWLGIDDDSGNI